MKTIRASKKEDGTGELTMFGVVGWDEGITAKDVSDALEQLDGVERLTITVNSNGGDVFDGYAIYNLLNQFDAPKRVEIVGAAMSAMSIIAMAGDEIALAESGMIMIHDPWTIGAGNAEEMLDIAENLQAHEVLISKIYHDRTGIAEPQLRQWMHEETYFSTTATGSVLDAIEHGFATEAIGNKRAAYNFTEPLKYCHKAPDDVRDLIDMHANDARRWVEIERAKAEQRREAG